MYNETKVEEILNDLVNSGSSIPYIKELKESSIDEIRKDKPLRDVLKDISNDIEYFTQIFLNSKNLYDNSIISGVSTGIYIPSYEDNSKYKYTIIGGDKSRNSNDKIDKDTVFDIASITKLYTLILLFKFEEMGLVDLDQKISDINPDFKNLGDFTLNDLIKLYGELRTDGNVATASSYEEAMERFKSMYLASDDRTKNKYTDFGAMIIADTIEKIVSKNLGVEMKYDEIMNKFLFEPLNIYNTIFNPKTTNVSGTGYGSNVVHDPKSRILGGVTGHAGLFTNSEDLMKLSDGLFNGEYLDQEHIKRLSETTVKGSSRGNLGVYLKHPNGLADTFNPSELSDESFSSQGFTGSVATFDTKNKIHNNILVNAIIDDENAKNNKPADFFKYLEDYQVELIKRIMLIYVVKKYYNKYCKVQEDVEIEKTI